MPAIAKRITSIITALCFIAVALVVYVQFMQKDDEYQVTAYFEKGIGLFPNSDVTILGVEVGKISRVEPVGSRVRVDMNIRSEFKIPADATAEIVPISLISDRYIEFAPVYESGPTLPDGATLDVADTKIPAELDDVFKQLKKLLDALAPEEGSELGSLGEMIVALDKALSGREQDLKGTIVNGAQLTRTLARARGDISNLLINLDELFGKLAPHAGDFATLNKNFAIVMQYLADSRQDIEGTLENLSEMTGEIGDFVRDNRTQLASLLESAAQITPVVLKNKESVQDSLAWLPVVGEGLRNAYHGGDINATDVRSDRPTAGLCEDFDDLFPIEDLPPPLQDIFEDILDTLEDEFCPSPDSGGGGGVSIPASPAVPDAPTTPRAPEDLIPDLKLECGKAIKTIKKQIDRIEELGISDELKAGIVDPLEKRIKKLRRKCDQLGSAGEDPSDLEDILDELPDDVRKVIPPEVEDTVPDLDNLTGNAAGGAASGPPSPSIGEQIGSWFGGFMGFVGVSS
jgi:phospholipid/cholesterol/gamma-HCH transport system substrate-binding protein